MGRRESPSTTRHTHGHCRVDERDASNGEPTRARTPSHMRIALRARRRFAMLLAFGLTLLLVVPAALNAAVVMGLIPTKGLTLPFFSYGRSSLLACCVAVGGLLSVARERCADPRELEPSIVEALCARAERQKSSSAMRTTDTDGAPVRRSEADA